MAVVNLRGTSGSGKSTLGHYLVDNYPHEEIYEDGWNKVKPRLIGYQLPGDLVVLGSYRARGGGLDTLAPHDRSLLLPLIRRYALRHSFVFFEALVISSTVPKYVELANGVAADSAGSQRFVFPFLDTPVDLCIANVYTRNGGKPIKEDNIRGHHAYMTRIRQRLIGEGFECPIIRHGELAFEDLERLLREKGWSPSVEPVRTEVAAPAFSI